MLPVILTRLTDLLTQGQIDYPDLKAIVDDLPQLTEAELDTLITRLDALHRLLLALKAKRQASAAAAATEVR